MARKSHRKLLRTYGAVDEDGNRIPPEEVPKGKRNKVPVRYLGTTLMVSVGEGQLINPEKEYMRQMGISKKELKKRKKKFKKKAL